MKIWTEIESPNILNELSNRLNQLKAIPFEKLETFPGATNETATIGDQDVTFIIYRETEDNGDIEIVLQASLSLTNVSLSKRAQVSADGFRMTPSGEILPLPKGIIYYYK
jgi:hypothetical protein